MQSFTGFFTEVYLSEATIPDNIKDELIITPVKWIDEVLNLVLTRQPVPWEKPEELSDKVQKKGTKGRKKTIGTH